MPRVKSACPRPTFPPRCRWRLRMGGRFPEVAAGPPAAPSQTTRTPAGPSAAATVVSSGRPRVTAASARRNLVQEAALCSEPSAWSGPECAPVTGKPSQELLLRPQELLCAHSCLSCGASKGDTPIGPLSPHVLHVGFGPPFARPARRSLVVVPLACPTGPRRAR